MTFQKGGGVVAIALRVDTPAQLTQNYKAERELPLYSNLSQEGDKYILPVKHSALHSLCDRDRRDIPLLRIDVYTTRSTPIIHCTC